MPNNTLMERLAAGPKDTFNAGQWNMPRSGRVAFWVSADGMMPTRILAPEGATRDDVERELSEALGCRVCVRWEASATDGGLTMAPCNWF